MLLVGLGASAVGYAIFAFSESYSMLLVSRLVQGAGGGTTGVVQAYVADSVAPRARARALGWLSAVSNAGVVIGPLIGSLATQLGPHAPGLLAAALCLTSLLFAARFLPESRTALTRIAAAEGGTPLRVLTRVVTHPGTVPSRLIWMYTIGIGAFYGVVAVLVLFANRRFGVTEETIGVLFAYMGALGIVFRLVLLGWIVDRIGEMRTARVGAAALALGLAGLPLAHPLALPGLLAFAPLVLATGLLSLGPALLFPSVTAQLSCVIGEAERGLYMGVQQTFGGAARVAYPLWAGFAWDHLGHGVPFWTSAALVAGTIWMGTDLARGQRRTGAPPPAQVVKTVAAKDQEEAVK